MTRAESIRAALGRTGESRTVLDVRIGLGYTAITLDDERTGVAYTFPAGFRAGCSVLEGIRPLTGRPATQLLDLLGSSDFIRSSLGLACANALSNADPTRGVRGDVLDAVGIRTTDTVGMVGFFAPLVARIEREARSLVVFDENREDSPGTAPASEAPQRLANCDVALITSTAIINGSCDGLLSAAANCREVVLLGSSTPMLPGAFMESPVTWLSGITVENPAGILRIVSEGGGTRQFKPHVTKWNLRAGRNRG